MVVLAESRVDFVEATKDCIFFDILTTCRSATPTLCYFRGYCKCDKEVVHRCICLSQQVSLYECGCGWVWCGCVCIANTVCSLYELCVAMTT